MDGPQQSPIGLGANEPRLQIDGLVAQPCAVNTQDLAHLPRDSVNAWRPNPYDGVESQDSTQAFRGWAGKALFNQRACGPPPECLLESL